MSRQIISAYPGFFVLQVKIDDSQLLQLSFNDCCKENFWQAKCARFWPIQTIVIYKDAFSA